MAARVSPRTYRGSRHGAATAYPRPVPREHRAHVNRIPPVLRSFIFGAIFAGAAVGITLVLRTTVGGALLDSWFTPLAILVVIEVVWAFVALRKPR